MPQSPHPLYIKEHADIGKNFDNCMRCCIALPCISVAMACLMEFATVLMYRGLDYNGAFLGPQNLGVLLAGGQGWGAWIVSVPVHRDMELSKINA